MFNINLTKNIFFSFFLSISFAISVYAQEVEEVVVTATKKEESLQDVALSVEAFSSDDIATQQIFDLSDIAESVPGLGTSKSVGSGSGHTIRGIGSLVLVRLTHLQLLQHQTDTVLMIACLLTLACTT